MLISLLLASQFYLASDRASFWDTEKISNQTTYVMDVNSKNTNFDKKLIESKRILLLVHGYNNDLAEVLSTYQLINTQISAFKDNQDSKFYDLVIGYLWPGDDSGLEYFDAKSRVPQLAKKMRDHLKFLSNSAAKIDILAHSMGNFLIFEALNYLPSENKKVIHNFYALAPAIDNESIEKEEKYYFSTQNCEKIFVFFSEGDAVLKWLYHLAEWDGALGYKGVENIHNLPSNIELVNYTNIVQNHSQYFTLTPFYEFIKQHFF